MDLTRYVDELVEQLMVAAEAGGEETRSLALRLLAPMESSARLVLLDALSAAAAEITLGLAPATVEVRLRGRDPEFVVTAPATVGEPAASEPAEVADEGGTARLTLRMSDQLKGRVEDVAAREGVSVNAWLVRTVTAAATPAPRRSSSPSGGQSITGWAR